MAFAGQLLRENLARQSAPEAAQAEAIVEMVNQGISEARHLARGLYPVRLEVDGLASALEELAASVQARTGIACRFSCDEPVCIFDEVDAPLDEPNIQRLMRLLEEMSGQTQFIIITHAKRTMEAADALYGVTMQEPGVSRLVSVRLKQASALPPPPPMQPIESALPA